MMMFMPRDLINKMAIADMRGADQTIRSEEFQRAVDGGLGEAGQFLVRLLIYIRGREVFA